MKIKILSLALSLGLGLSGLTANATDLTDIYRMALENDPQLLRASAERDAARSAVDVSRADWYPQIGFRLGYNYNDSDSTANVVNPDDPDGEPVTAINGSSSRTFNRELTLSQEVFNLGTWRATGIVEKQAYQAEVNYLLTRQQLMLRVTDAYFSILAARDNLEFAQSEKRAIERQLDQTRHRFSVGLTAVTDVHEAQAQYDQALAREIQAQNSVEIAYEALREITGRQHQNVHVLNTELFEPVTPQPESPRQWVDLAHERNLQLLISRSGLEIADQRIELARSGHYPTVSLTASYGNRDVNYGGGRSYDGLDSSSIGLQLNVPLFSGGRTVASTEEARSDYVAVSQTLEENRRAVEREVRSAYLDVVANISTINALEQAVVSADSALNATQAGFEVGTRTIVDVLDSTRNLFNARRNLSEARYGYIQGILQLQQAAGTISEDELFAINDALRPAPQDD
ncbi:outer membrane channel protein TolC [Aliidiomarina sedimenti]|uniref:Outer membrane channel protein TolC n=1 Tax=Aliidiomarina sedimenti TaxID=1933879 RepID=A0ABY0BZB8_9GAMM|nr:outer membrane channel protein TolC [Aliidiomarina sedimenti]RUO30046.1 outer membrane channel protein TolC [Aliidiomarina sedimenti]